MQKLIGISVFAFVLISGPKTGLAQGLPVFPGAVGFGADTRAGRGGVVHKVTNLNASGAGSLKACTDASGPRVCVFEVAGTIKLTSDINIKEPFLTIAGQTAPSPGIMIRGAALRVNTNNILIQHVRLRVGDAASGPEPRNRDSLKLEGSSSLHHVVIDHVSASWGIDETISLWGPGIHDITISNSIISEGLFDSIHPSGIMGKGLIVGAPPGGPEPANIAIVRNLMAHNFERNPLMTNGVLVNNVMYNWQWRATEIRGAIDAATKPVRASVVGNAYVRGSASNGYLPININNLVAGSQVFLNDNQAAEYDGRDPWSIADVKVSFTIAVSSAPLWPASLVAIPSTQVKNWVLSNAGARPADRDSVDTRVVASVRNNSGSIIDCVESCSAGDRAAPGGWPSLATNRRVLALPSNPAGDDDRDGYTNLEEWLHAYSAQVEGVGSLSDLGFISELDAPPSAPALLVQ